MKKTLFVFVIAMIFLVGCGDEEKYNKNKFGLNEEKIIEKATLEVEKNLSLRPFFKKEYKKDDIKINKICKATLKTSANFKGEYIILWETKDKEQKGELLLNDNDELENITSSIGTTSHEIYKNKCIKLN